MIIVSAKFTAKPGLKDKIAEVSREAVELTRREKGNISYTLLSSTEDDTFMYYEEWEDLDSLKAHLKTEHIAAAREARRDMITGPVSVRVFEAKEVSL
ncbi:MAG: putative quinol monooxygenase [Synergistaceae bacterium]|nr:putative quinol monooxygenase [Synergistaceae bacterium]